MCSLKKMRKIKTFGDKLFIEKSDLEESKKFYDFSKMKTKVDILLKNSLSLKAFTRKRTKRQIEKLMFNSDDSDEIALVVM